MGPIRNPRWEQKRTEGYVIVSMWVRAEVNRWQTTDDGRQVMVKAHIAFGKVSLQQSLGRYVAPLRHIILIPSQPVFNHLQRN
jgi:hypothetical protein